MGEKQGLEIVLGAATILQGNWDIRFVMCGEGTAKSRSRGEFGKVVSRCGVVTPLGDASVFSNAFQKLAVDPDRRVSLGMEGRLIAEKHFSTEAVIRKFEQELGKVVYD
ncbi:MAG: hypothetical protein COZ23_10700 [Hydrogenophilales bacterium CG_4_10_14_3_um_filter_58_23]|nr:MAG: hypothetical protein COX55_00210 [Zetaproteobacteria bacterium CG23_combo_of_CG06-09_8_20_14_all_54_7]PIQ13011.1 MAG: hypothetical protein COW70_06820 [Hydrogenophilales bacterium CG18_big_fil_WC_8_21_14_2_50_58_12]PIX99646.1 MAG: hypothetical protein COZ23_10700 [Hydrogenophilales bacterium CG_4_10_14_3_um_filter_58_23]